MQKTAVQWLVVAAATMGLNASVLAQDPDAGKTEYLSGCAACHGIDGKGKGPLSADLKTAPADLTVIAKRNGGVFPVTAVYETVDGRKAIKSHGTRDMPIWGDRFIPPPTPAASSKPSEPNLQLFYDYYRSENIIRIRILALVDYLSRIQEK